jgi:hypothetical protein
VSRTGTTPSILETSSLYTRWTPATFPSIHRSKTTARSSISPITDTGSQDMGPITEMESVSINRTAARFVAGQGMTQSARTPASLGTSRKARSESEPGIWRGKAWNGRAGQAFALVEFGVVDRATTNSSPRTTTGHKQDDQAAKTKPPTGSCSRILDQSLGSTRARSSRNRPLE